MRERDHLFDGALDGTGTCATCGKPYDTGDGRHDFGKLVTVDEDAKATIKPSIRPYVAADAVREQAELDAEDAHYALLRAAREAARLEAARAAIAADPDPLLRVALRLSDPIGGLDLMAALITRMSADPDQPNVGAYLHEAAADLRTALGLLSPERNAQAFGHS